MIGRHWDDSQRLLRKLAELKLRGLSAERVRTEYARRWDAAACLAQNHHEAGELGRKAAHSWLDALTLDKALALK